jgi:N-acetylglucosaminyldiphosphoundecaprenol N-acetyl-beta-D-mannosaminyltransferase
MTKIDILGVKIDKVTTAEALEKIEEFIKSGKPHYVVTPNAEMVMIAQEDEEFKEVLNNADLATSDGIGILWAAKYLSIGISRWPIVKHLQAIWQMMYTGASLVFYPRYCRSVLPERVSGTDLLPEIARNCAGDKCAVYLLGAGPGVAEKVAEKLKQRYTYLKVCGTYSGSPYREDEEEIIAKIIPVRPSVLFVAYGPPNQEKWIFRNLNRLGVPVSIAVGGAFDFITGSKSIKAKGVSTRARRAPKVFQKLGLEWFWRGITQPWRAKRIFISVPKFIFKVVKWKIETCDM